MGGGVDARILSARAVFFREAGFGGVEGEDTGWWWWNNGRDGDVTSAVCFREARERGGVVMVGRGITVVTVTWSVLCSSEARERGEVVVLWWWWWWWGGEGRDGDVMCTVCFREARKRGGMVVVVMVGGGR